MRSVIRRMSSAGQLIGRVQTGRNALEMVSSNRKIYTSLNGPCILVSKSEKDFTSRAVPVLSMVVAALNVGEGDISLLTKKESPYNKMLDTFLKSLSKDSENVEIKVLSLKPDQMQTNESPQGQVASVSPGLGKYYRELKKLAVTLAETKDLSDILLRTELSKTMWGGKEVSSVLGSIKKDTDKLSGDYGKLEAFLEWTDNDVRRIKALEIGKEQAVGGEEIIKECTCNVQDNFQSIKLLVSDLASALYRLYDIDKIFKKYTRYPTTWFFNSSIFYDFLYNFENLIKGMIQLASIEKNIMEPILLKTAGDYECQII